VGAAATTTSREGVKRAGLHSRARALSSHLSSLWLLEQPFVNSRPAFKV
jgi:hypothetical protein